LRRTHCFQSFRSPQPENPLFLLIAISKPLCYSLVASCFKRSSGFWFKRNSIMEDHTVLVKMAVSSLAGLLFFATAVFATMLELPIFWRNVWLALCITFFVAAVAGVFMLCGDLNSEHSKPEDTRPRET
jgi:hypothetical protein